MASKMLLNKPPTPQVASFGAVPRPQRVPLGQRVIVHAEEPQKAAKAAKEGGEKAVKAAKEGGEKAVKAAKEGGEKAVKSAKEAGDKSAKAAKSGGGGKDKFVGQYKSGEGRPKNTLFLASDQSLSYLDGSLAGDFGFDPLGLLDPEGAGDEGFISPPWLVYAEIINARWAMLGVLGCAFPEILAHLGVIPQGVDEMTWFRSGVFPPGGSRQYWLDPYALFFIEIWLFNIVELRRLRDYKEPGSMKQQFFLGLEKGLGGSGEPAYPGGLFNPLGFAEGSEQSKQEYRTKELRNGRLAMLAILGFAVQGTLTNVGPIQNLIDHLNNPGANNFLTTFQRLYAPTA